MLTEDPAIAPGALRDLPLAYGIEAARLDFLPTLEIAGDDEVTRLYRRRCALAEVAEYADRLSAHGDDAEDPRAREQLIHWLAEVG